MDTTRKDSFKEKIDRLATGFAAITSIPVFGLIVKMIFDKIQEKGAEALGKRIENILGVGLEDAKKDVSDEIIYSVAVASLTENEQKEVDCFERRLRAEDKNKAEALILFVAKMVKMFEQEVKEATHPKKGESGPSVSRVYKKIEEGVEHAKNFLKAMLGNSCQLEEDTFRSRVAFLEGKNVFSLIKEKKTPLNEKAKETAEKVGVKYAEGMDNLNSKLGDLLSRAQAWRDRA